MKKTKEDRVMHFDLDNAIRKVPDFPKKGITFYDITSVLSNPAAIRFIEAQMVSLYEAKGIDKIVAVDARGFLFAPLLGRALNLPVVLARKKGKLPNETYRAEYELEYGTDIIEIQKLDLLPGEHLLIVDDLIATGGTLVALRNIIEQAGSSVSNIFCIIGLPFLNYHERLKGVQIDTLIDYHHE